MSPSSPLERLRAWSALLPLLVLLAGTYWLSRQVLPLPPVPDFKTRHDPDYIVSNFSSVEYDAEGAPRFILAADKMEHYPDNDTTYLSEPRLTAPYRDRPPVHISAMRGEVSRNGDDIFLRDNVQFLREAAPGSGEIRVATTYLHVVPDEETADTDRPITLTDPRGVTTATGMTVDNRKRTIQLLSRVRAQYEPAHR